MTCEVCGGPHEPNAIDRKFGCPDADGRRRLLPLVLRRSRGYRGDLARFPGDLSARVGSRRDEVRLEDRRKREGWVTPEALPPPPKDLAQAAYERALSRPQDVRLRETKAASVPDLIRERVREKEG